MALREGEFRGHGMSTKVRKKMGRSRLRRRMMPVAEWLCTSLRNTL